MRSHWVFLSLLTGAALWAQSTAPDVAPEATFRSDTRLVVLNVSVFKDGKVVKDASFLNAQARRVTGKSGDLQRGTARCSRHKAERPRQSSRVA